MFPAICASILWHFPLRVCYIANAAAAAAAHTTNTPHCMFFCWIYWLLVFGQRHNSHLSCFISELIYFRITQFFFLFSFVRWFFFFIFTESTWKMWAFRVSHCHAFDLLCTGEFLAPKNLCFVWCFHANQQLISIWLNVKNWIFFSKKKKNDSVWPKGNFCLQKTSNVMSFCTFIKLFRLLKLHCQNKIKTT